MDRSWRRVGGSASETSSSSSSGNYNHKGRRGGGRGRDRDRDRGNQGGRSSSSSSGLRGRGSNSNNHQRGGHRGGGQHQHQNRSLTPSDPRHNARRFARPKKGKLLVLDINHVLIARRGGKKGALKRPHCDAFLEMCFGNFDVMVWSCGVMFGTGGEPNDKYRDEMAHFEKWSDEIVAVWVESSRNQFRPTPQSFSRGASGDRGPRPLPLSRWLRLPTLDHGHTTATLHGHTPRSASGPSPARKVPIKYL